MDDKRESRKELCIRGLFRRCGLTPTDDPQSQEWKQSLSGRELISNFIYNWRVAQTTMVFLIPMFLMALAGLGLWGRKWPIDRLRREIFIIGFCLVTVVGYSASWVLGRYLFILIPCFLGWISLGLLHGQTWYTRSSRSSFTTVPRVRQGLFLVLCIVGIYFYLFPINFYVRSRDSDWQARSYEERDAGRWLVQNGRRMQTCSRFTRRRRSTQKGLDTGQSQKL